MSSILGKVTRILGTKGGVLLAGRGAGDADATGVAVRVAAATARCQGCGPAGVREVLPGDVEESSTGGRCVLIGSAKRLEEFARSRLHARGRSAHPEAARQTEGIAGWSSCRPWPWTVRGPCPARSSCRRRNPGVDHEDDRQGQRPCRDRGGRRHCMRCPRGQINHAPAVSPLHAPPATPARCPPTSLGLN